MTFVPVCPDAATTLAECEKVPYEFFSTGLGLTPQDAVTVLPHLIELMLLSVGIAIVIRLIFRATGARS